MPVLEIYRELRGNSIIFDLWGIWPGYAWIPICAAWAFTASASSPAHARQLSIWLSQPKLNCCHNESSENTAPLINPGTLFPNCPSICWCRLMKGDVQLDWFASAQISTGFKCCQDCTAKDCIIRCFSFLTTAQHLSARVARYSATRKLFNFQAISFQLCRMWIVQLFWHCRHGNCSWSFFELGRKKQPRSSFGGCDCVSRQKHLWHLSFLCGCGWHENASRKIYVFKFSFANEDRAYKEEKQAANFHATCVCFCLCITLRNEKEMTVRHH